MPRYYLEDLHPGDTFEFGSHTVTAASIVAFAREYDPQPFHTDEAQARASAFGGLIASGWQTAGIFMRLVVDGLINQTASLGSPGVDELRWLRPVRPGDTLRARFIVVEAVPSASRPDRGRLRSVGEVLNQRDEVVMRLQGTNFIERRPGGE
jgi:acyl dehydratase